MVKKDRDLVALPDDIVRFVGGSLYRTPGAVLPPDHPDATFEVRSVYPGRYCPVLVIQRMRKTRTWKGGCLLVVLALGQVLYGDSKDVMMVWNR
jgi:hypothetical protein